MKNLVKYVLISFLAIGGLTSLTAQEAEKLFQQGMMKEEAEGNLTEAIEIYSQLAEDASVDREFRANALLHIGICNEKLGKKNANTYYEKVISNYSDQPEMVKLAQERLLVISTLMDPISKKRMLTVQKLYSSKDFYGGVSHSGKYVTFTDWGDANLYYIDILTKEKKPVTTIGTWEKPIKYADYSIWSPDDKKIAYGWYDQSVAAKGYQLKIWNKETEKTETVIKVDNSFVWPVEWTKDGKEILTIGGNRDSLEVGLLNINTKKQKTFKRFKRDRVKLLSGGLPTISPDGNYILLIKLVTHGNHDIFIISSESGEENVISNHSANEWGVKWNNDGKSFLFASDRTGSPALYKMAIKNGKASGDPVLLYEGITDSYIPQVISNDQLIYNNSTNYSDIYLADVNTIDGTVSNHSVLIEESQNLFHPEWSNDGEKIAFIKTNPNLKGDQLLIRNIETGKEQTIDIGVKIEKMGSNPRWSHDDKLIIMEHQQGGGFNLAIVDIEKETVKLLDEIGRPVIFGPNNTIFVGKHYDPYIIRMNLSTYKTDTIITGEIGTSYQELKVSQDRKYLSFFENMIKFTSQKRLCVINLETKKFDIIWEAGENYEFVRRQINWLSDNENIIVLLAKLDKNGNTASMQPYKVNIKTKEKIIFGAEISDPNDFHSFDINTKGDSMVYKKEKEINNVWLLKL